MLVHPLKGRTNLATPTPRLGGRCGASAGPRPAWAAFGHLGLALAAACLLLHPAPAAKAKVGRALYEPASGAYLGAALDTAHPSGEAGVPGLVHQMRDFVSQVGHPQALYLFFNQFPNAAGHFGSWDRDANGWESPAEFATAANAVGAAAVLTLEPQRPQEFLNWHAGSPAYDATRAFARGAGAFGKPVFIRFAHEMNGNWYPWAEWIDKNRNFVRDPGEDTGFTAADYVKAYRNVALMFRRYAPNAALVWCPNSGLLGGSRRDVFRPWYPGDDVVDWVGLDVYERGWTMPMPGAHLWGGQFGHNLTHDMAEGGSSHSPSVNFYRCFGEQHQKPVMICETSASLTYRSDLPLQQREDLDHDWKTGLWNGNEYGWLYGVLGTSQYKDEQFLEPIDQIFPQVKAIVWFQIAKHEDVPVQKSDGTHQWFDHGWTDYRIGATPEPGHASPYASQEIRVYHSLTQVPWFLDRISTPHRSH